MRRYQYRYIYNWDANLAYFAGLMASDGCLSKDGRHLFMVSKDLDIINATQHITDSSAKLVVKIGQFGTWAYHYQFSNVALYDFLLNSGITPAKSKTIKKVKLPPQYYADFLRGYFDGDGTVYGYRDHRWKNSYMYYVGFVSASYEFLVWLQQQNTHILKTSPGRIKPGLRVYILTYAKGDSLKLFLGMYHASGEWRLGRKYTKFRDFINSDPHGKIKVNARVL